MREVKGKKMDSNIILVICMIGIGLCGVGVGFFVGRMYENMVIYDKVFQIIDEYESKLQDVGCNHCGSTENT